MKVPYLCHTISYIEVDICVNCNFSLATIQFNMQCLSRWAGGLNTYMYMCIDRRVYDVEISVGVMRVYIYVRLCICKQLKRVDVRV